MNAIATQHKFGGTPAGPQAHIVPPGRPRPVSGGPRIPARLSGDALERLARDYQPLVRSIARRFFERVPRTVQLDDLISEGNVGLLESLRRYQPDRAAFGSFARERIAGQIRDYLRSLDPATRAQRNEFNRGGEVTLPVLCSEDLLEGVADGRLPADEALAERQHAEHVRDAIFTELPVPRHRFVIHEHFLAGRTLASVGRDLGVTESRASQIKRAALLKMARSASFRGLGKAA